MSSVTWTINDVAARTFATNLRISRRNQVPDEFNFRVPTADVTGAPPYAFEDPVVLKRDGVPYFSGVVTVCAASRRGGAEFWDVKVSGPWWWLESWPYRQPRTYISPTFTEFNQLMGGRIIMAWDTTKALPVSIDTAVLGILNTVIAVASPFAIGDISALFTTPLMEAKDLTLAEAMRQLLRWVPDGVVFYDYSTSPPTMRLKRRSGLTAVAVDLADRNLVEDFSVDPHHDRQVAGVIFNFLGSVTDPATKITYATNVEQTAGNVGGNRVVQFSIDLQGAGTDNQEPIPEGLAATYYNMTSNPPWGGSLDLHEQECSGLLRPGLSLNLLSGETAWATMAALIQTTEEDLDNGLTHVEFGLPEHLGAADFVSLALANRKVMQTVPTGAGNTSTPQHGDAPNPDKGKTPLPAPGVTPSGACALLELCDGTTLNVRLCG